MEAVGLYVCLWCTECVEEGDAIDEGICIPKECTSTFIIALGSTKLEGDITIGIFSKTADLGSPCPSSRRYRSHLPLICINLLMNDLVQ